MPDNTFIVGSVEITVLHDAEVASPFSQSFPDVPQEAWEPFLTRYPDAFIGRDSRALILNATWLDLRAELFWSTPDWVPARLTQVRSIGCLAGPKAFYWMN